MPHRFDASPRFNLNAVLAACCLATTFGFVAVDDAAAQLYEGQWENLTFGSTGAIALELDVTGSTFSGTMDADGFVFGLDNPGPLSFTGTVAGDGSLTFDPVVMDPFWGNGSGGVDMAGIVQIDFTDVPAAGVSSVGISGTFDGVTWDLDYTVFEPLFGQLSAGGPDETILAEGTIDMALIPEPASVALLATGGLVLTRGRRR